MRLRMLELKDAPFMLEWMHDENVVGKLRGYFKEKTLSYCEEFIRKSAKIENLQLRLEKVLWVEGIHGMQWKK